MLHLHSYQWISINFIFNDCNPLIPWKCVSYFFCLKVKENIHNTFFLLLKITCDIFFCKIPFKSSENKKGRNCWTRLDLMSVINQRGFLSFRVSYANFIEDIMAITITTINLSAFSKLPPSSLLSFRCIT